MNSLAFACAALIGPAAVVFGGPTDRAIIAAMTLSERPNYTWFSTIDDPTSSYEIEGRTTPAGITWVRMPMLSSIGRRLGRERDTHLEALFQGGTRGVVHLGDDWKPIAELPVLRTNAATRRSRPMVRGSASGGSFGIPGAPALGSAAPYLNNTRSSQSFSTLRFGVTHPHEELSIIVSSYTSMDAADDVVTGTLSDMGAALLLVRPEQTDVEPIASAGDFKLWIKNGVVIKYQLRLEGVVAVEQRRKLNVHMNSTTSLKEIGTTEVNVPDAALVKLARVSARSL